MQQLIDKWKKDKKNLDPTTSLISEFLLPTLESWWWQPFDKGEIRETLNLCQHSENADVLKKVHINEEVFKCIGSKGREADESLHYVNHSLTRAAHPLASAWDTIIHAENCFKDHNEAASDGTVTVALLDGSGLNLSEVCACLDLSLKVLGMTNVQLVPKRCAALKDYLNKDYQALCDRSHGFNWQMFGNNLRGQVDELNQFNRLASQVSSAASGKKKSSPTAQAWRSHFLSNQNQNRRGQRTSSWNSSPGYRQDQCLGQGYSQNRQQPQQHHNPRGRGR